MIKTIKFIMQKVMPAGGLKIVAVEMVAVPGGFPEEKPLPGVTVSVTQEGGQPIIGITDTNGEYLELHLPVGSYKIGVVKDGYGSQEKAETVV